MFRLCDTLLILNFTFSSLVTPVIFSFMPALSSLPVAVSEPFIPPRRSSFSLASPFLRLHCLIFFVFHRKTSTHVLHHKVKVIQKMKKNQRKMLLQILQERKLKEIFKIKKLGIMVALTFLLLFTVRNLLIWSNTNLDSHYHEFIALILVKN